MIKYRESTLNWPPNCPKNGVHLLGPVKELEPIRFGE